MEKRLDLTIRDTVYEPGVAQQKILLDESLPDHPRYKVWVFLDGPDLPYVKGVTYHLHPTFPEPVRAVRRTASNPSCALPIWTWGLFQVAAEVEDKSGHRHTYRHHLRYNREIKAKNAQFERTRLES